MRQHLKKVKRTNEAARLVGLDIGRKYTGVALTDRSITQSRPLRTLLADPQEGVPVHDLHKNNSVFAALRRIFA